MFCWVSFAGIRGSVAVYVFEFVFSLFAVCLMIWCFGFGLTARVGFPCVGSVVRCVGDFDRLGLCSV